MSCFVSSPPVFTKFLACIPQTNKDFPIFLFLRKKTVSVASCLYCAKLQIIYYKLLQFTKNRPNIIIIVTVMRIKPFSLKRKETIL